PAFSRGKIFLAGGDDSFYALNAETLQVLWKAKLGDNSPEFGYYGWSSPSVADDLVYQGIASHCDDPFVDGRVVALGAASGATAASAGLSPPTGTAPLGAGGL